MTLESTVNKNRFIGNGSVNEFPFTFKVWKPDQVRVFLGNGDIENDVSSSCTIEISKTGGRVIFPTAPSEGEIIAIRRSMPFVQEDDYANGSRFDAENIEDRFDQDCAERQDLRLDLERAFKIPETTDKAPEEYMQSFWEKQQQAVDAVNYVSEFVAGIPIIKDSIKDVEESPADGFYWAKGYGDAGERGDNIGSRTVVPDIDGAVPRTLAARAADVTNVRDFGAVGDGETDDTDAVQAAFSAAGSSAVLFPAGTYAVDELPDMSRARGSGSLAVGDAVLPAGDIREPLTIDFPGCFDSIQDIVSYLDARGIYADVEISIASGEYALTEQIEIEHPNGDHISIVGAGKSETSLVFSLPANESKAGIKIVGPYKIKKIDGLTLDGNDLYGYTGGSPDDSAGSSEDPCGVRLEDGASCVVGPDVAVKDFARCGIAAFRGSSIVASGVAVSGCGSDNFCASQCSVLFATGTASSGSCGNGFNVDGGATIWANGSTSTGNLGRSGAKGHGYVATTGGTLFANGAVSTSNAGSGFLATRNGYISAPESEAKTNGVHGYAASYAGNIYADGAVAGGDDAGDGNTKSGFYADNAGVIGASGATSKNNGQHGVVAQVWGRVNFYGGLVTANANNGGHVTNGGILSIDGAQGVTNNGGYGLECTTGGLVLAGSVSMAAKVTGNTTAAIGGTQVSGTGRDKSYVYIAN